MMTRLERCGRQRHFTAGEVVLRQDEPSTCLHAIVRGRVRVERVYSNLFATMLLAEAGPGDVVGAAEVLYGHSPNTTVTAIAETDTLEVRAEALTDLVVEQLQEAASLLALLSRRASAPDPWTGTASERLREVLDKPDAQPLRRMGR